MIIQKLIINKDLEDLCLSLKNLNLLTDAYVRFED